MRNPAADMTATKPRYQAEQLELPLHVTASAGFTVRRVEGHIVLTPKPIEIWGTVADAAKRLRRCERWVRILCEAGVIPARKLPGAKIWDVNMIALEEWIAKGDHRLATDNLRNYRQSRKRES